MHKYHRVETDVGSSFMTTGGRQGAFLVSLFEAKAIAQNPLIEHHSMSMFVGA
jgi:hypothetical protein